MEDLEFLKIMEAECYQDSSNSWVAPLPFRSPRERLPNNRKQVFDRLVSLQRSLEKRPQMKVDFLEFMEKMFEKAHAEVAPRQYSLDKSVGTYLCSVCIIQGNQIEFVWSSTAVHHMKECRSTISCSLVPTLIIAC